MIGSSSYGDRLAAAVGARGALCVGIDPHAAMLAAWGLENDVHGLESCARGMVDALGDIVAVFKPQSAFFEVFGSRGIAVLEATIDAARAAGALVVLDVKRGDIGSTMAAYAAAYLRDEAPLAVDAITVSPYLGFGSLAPALDLAHQSGRGVYVLARTSNPEGGDVQLATTADGRTVLQTIVDAAVHVNDETGQGAVGLVVGATHALLECDLTRFNGSLLVPGIGAQGGSLDDLPGLFGNAHTRVLPSTSRDVMQSGPQADSLRSKVSLLLSHEGQPDCLERRTAGPVSDKWNIRRPDPPSVL